jgi:3-oxoacyl-[acyl-carrier protein] reductase
MAYDHGSRVALVTGSTTGLGRAMAFALGRSGARVAFNFAHDAERAAAAFSAFEAEGLVGCLVQGDVTSEEGVADIVAAVTERLGPVDVLIPNATGPQPQKPIEDYGWDLYQEMLDFFVKSPYLLTRAVLPHMKQQRWGRILNIGSEVYDRGVPNFSAYVSAKGAQRGWTRSMAMELAPWSITVNMISPGWIPVERHADDPQEDKDAYLAQVPLGRWGVPDDIGGAVDFLASEQAGFITGQTLVVNGGLTVC